MKKLFLVDQSSFADIRLQGGVYVDKTKEIYDCIGKSGKYFFLARPRRFGKSLLCSTLKEMFSGNRGLFKGLWLDGSDWSWEKHPIIHLDMSQAAGDNNNVAGFIEQMLALLKNIARAYDVPLSSSGIVGLVFSQLVVSLYEKTGKKVVVLIDEYDKPILDLCEQPEHRDALHRELSSFYAQLKPLETSLRFVLLTGVYKFSKTSIFSKLNNLTDLTFSPRAGALLGYTQKEIESCFSEEIDALAAKGASSRAEMIEKLKNKYNGYHFGVDTDTGALSPGVYNPFGLNHTFNENQMKEEWFASGSPSYLIKKIKAGNFKEIGPDGLSVDFSFLHEPNEPNNITATTLLYYAGYGTMQAFNKENGYVQLGYPNAEIAEATSKRLMALFVGAGDGPDILKLAVRIADCFRKHQLDDFKELFNQVLAQLDYNIVLRHEKYFQTVIFLLLNSGRLRVAAEMHTNNGSMDVVIELPDQIYILELKFNEPAAKGLQQIKDKDYAKKLWVKGLPITAVGLSIALGKNIVQAKCVIDVAVEAL